MADHPENPTALVVSEHQDDDHFAELVAAGGVEALARTLKILPSGRHDRFQYVDARARVRGMDKSAGAPFAGTSPSITSRCSSHHNR